MLKMLRGILEGAQAGARAGRRFNTLTEDAARGNLLRRNSSDSDDTAQRLEETVRKMRHQKGR